MKCLIVVAILVIVGAVADECWWTGCQPVTWAVRGCNGDHEEQRTSEECDGGNKYRCCRNTANTTITTELVETPGCWWTGCQSNTWDVRGCNQDGMEKRRTVECEDGKRYQCCQSGRSPQNPLFRMGERLSCPLLDPDKKFLVRFGNYAVPACDLCPSFNQRHYRNRILHQDPVRTLTAINFPECFGACAQYSTDCLAFTHDSTERICYQFNSTTDTRMSSENGYTTVFMTQPTGRAGEWSYTRNTQLVAKEMAQIQSRTFQGCIASCDTISTCLAVSYNFSTSACYQFSDLEKIGSSLAIGHASAFKQESFASKNPFQKFKLMNDDLLT